MNILYITFKAFLKQNGNPEREKQKTDKVTNNP